MTEVPGEVAAVIRRVSSRKGRAYAVELGAHLLEDLRYEMQFTDADVRLVLGAACTTAARAVDQFVAALQLPYPASRGWEDMFHQLGEGGTSRRRYVFVADAGELLRHEEPELWYRLVADVRGGPYCLGGGWTTVVLVDDEYGWSRSRFGTATAAEDAARAGLQDAERPR
ncbi:hypothetical protein [Virgisporangium aurantiacum]|uniref:Barstar (Barnase inhibitor) n=1 Tax=Virgisporangium aurantiacum TaxID=175570 RepID=A0A8J3ZEK5_9ACTN|nr:hypothetical protein [Virgisporangium aurantiacum]GIJ60215.1 hypothetical protein Vau01_077310 [Virgisporangium aurantiacum]